MDVLQEQESSYGRVKYWTRMAFSVVIFSVRVYETYHDSTYIYSASFFIAEPSRTERTESNNRWKKRLRWKSIVIYAALYRNKLFVAAIWEWVTSVKLEGFVSKVKWHTAIVYSLGCQLACRIFLLKSRVSTCTWPSPTLGPFLRGCFTPASGPPIFFALNADLSAWSTISCSVSTSNIRK